MAGTGKESETTMANTLRIKRRAAGGAAGAPASLQMAEPAFNETDSTLYIGIGNTGANGSATMVIPIGGPGAFIDRITDQSVNGKKSFNTSPTAPTPAAGDSSTAVATTAFVTNAVAPVPQAANTVYAGPATGSASQIPTWRILTPADIPPLTSVKITDFSAASDARIAAAAGVSVCPLDSNKLVPAAFLPSYVDDVLEYDNLAAFPATGEKGKIYIADDTNWEYRWSGSAYIRIVASPGSTDALAEGVTNLYFTQARVLATVLTGLSLTSSAVIAATDSVLTAFGKLQAQTTLRLVAANNLSDLASPAAARTNLGLGTIAVQNANNVNLTGGLLDNFVLDGGTF